MINIKLSWGVLSFVGTLLLIYCWEIGFVFSNTKFNLRMSPCGHLWKIEEDKTLKNIDNLKFKITGSCSREVCEANFSTGSHDVMSHDRVPPAELTL